jgi:hypothetical protein
MDAVTGEQKRGELIDALRQELHKEKLVSFFSTAQELANLVSVAVSNWLSTGDDPGDMLRTRYLEQVSRLYGAVRVPVGQTTCALPAIFNRSLCTKTRSRPKTWSASGDEPCLMRPRRLIGIPALSLPPCEVMNHGISSTSPLCLLKKLSSSVRASDWSSWEDRALARRQR